MQNVTNALGAWGEFLFVNKWYRIRYLLGLMLCVVGVSLTVTAAAAPSDLDPAFGSGGKVISSPDGSQVTGGSGMAIQPDGKIIMVGGKFDTPQNLGFIVARYNPNGSLDATFGDNGWVSVTFGGSNEFAGSVAIQSDGKIVVGGTGSGGQFDAAVARLNSNGKLDATFDGDGKTTVDFGYQDYLTALKISDNGKIVFVGAGNVSLSLNYRILGRLNADGSLDSTFDGDGKLVDGAGSWSDLVVQPDGTIFAAGDANVAKYNDNGAREWLYSGQGRFNGIAAQPDGKPVVVGTFANKIIALRLNADGTADNSFSAALITPNGAAFSVAIQPDGKIVASIEFSFPFNAGFSVVRYNADGSLDSNFGTGGYVMTTVTGSNNIDRGLEILIQSDGKILVGGYSRISDSNPTRYYFSMVRYLGDSAAASASFDYDGDARADVSVFRNGTWYLQQSQTGFRAVQFGAAGDRIVPEDFDGDGKYDIAVFRSGNWYILQSSNNAFRSTNFGLSNDTPVSGDWDGDGKADAAVFRGGIWFVLQSSNNQFRAINFGVGNDRPVVGDFDGDNKNDAVVYRNGDWFVLQSSNNQFRAVSFGLASDRPVAADYDGDNKHDVAVFRDGNWFVLQSSNNQFRAVQFGQANDIPVAADYDGDGKADIAVFRDGNWFRLNSSNNQFVAVNFGIGGDAPTEAAYIP